MLRDSAEGFDVFKPSRILAKHGSPTPETLTLDAKLDPVKPAFLGFQNVIYVGP